MYEPSYVRAVLSGALSGEADGGTSRSGLIATPSLANIPTVAGSSVWVNPYFRFSLEIGARILKTNVLELLRHYRRFRIRLLECQYGRVLRVLDRPIG